MQTFTERLFALQGHKFLLVRVLIFCAILAPILFVTTFDYFQTKDHLTALTLERREAVAHMGAITVKERFDRLRDIGLSLATRVRFRQMVKEQKWEEAIQILKDVPKDIPFIERVIIVNPSGILMADIPHVPSVQGYDFSFRSWYQGAVATGKPFVSEIYARTAEPQYNVIGVGTPIFDDDKNLSGVLMIQVRLETLLEWSKQIDVGEDGFVYFIDEKGSVGGHPHFESQGEIINISSLSYVQKLLSGKGGVEMGNGQGDRIIAYSPVQNYGWGVITEQSSLSGFLLRDMELKHHLVLSGIVFAIALLLAYFIVRFLSILNDYRQRERIYLNSIGDGLVVIDRDWRIVLWNNSATQITGWSRKEVLGKPLRDILHFIRKWDRKENMRFIEDAMVTGTPQKLDTGTMLAIKDGREIDIGDSASPLFEKNGTVTGAIIIFRDESAHIQSQALRSDFVYASHQLRTPVTKALWSLEAIMGKKDVSEMKNAASVAHQAVKSVARLSEGLIAASEIDQQMIIAEKKPVKLSELFESALESGLKKAKEKKITLKFPTVSMTSSIMMNERLFKGIMGEIVDNAINYGDPKDIIDIRARPKDGQLIIAVEDAGIGIPEEDQALIFTKFFRGRNVDTTNVAGAGLGLYIAQAYARLLGGRIWFKPKERGTIFYVSVPME